MDWHISVSKTSCATEFYYPDSESIHSVTFYLIKFSKSFNMLLYHPYRIQLFHPQL